MAAGGEKATGDAAEGDAAPEADAGTAAAAAPLKPEEPLQTGEEDEATEFQVSAAAALLSYAGSQLNHPTPV